MFDKGDRVQTPHGAGVVVYRRMAPPSYAEVEAHSVKLDGKNHVGSMYAAEKVRAEARSMRSYTAVHWLGSEVWRETFEAETDGQALAKFEQTGPNAYDERRLLSGDVLLEDVKR